MRLFDMSRAINIKSDSLWTWAFFASILFSCLLCVAFLHIRDLYLLITTFFSILLEFSYTKSPLYWVGLLLKFAPSLPPI